MRMGENVSVAAVPGVVVRRHSAARFRGTGCLGKSGQEALSSFRTDGKTSSLPAGVPWGAGHGGRLGRPYFAHLPCEVEEGPAHRCSDREVLLCICPDCSPQREPPRTVLVPLEPRPSRSPDRGPYSQPVLGGVDAPRGPARRGVWEACGQSGGSRALAPPSSELGSPRLPPTACRRASARGHPAGRKVRAPGLGACRVGGGHVVRRGVPPGHAASAEGRLGPTQAATAGAWRRQLCALAEGGGPSAAVGPRQGRLALAAPCPTSGLRMPALVGAAAPRLDPQRSQSHPPRTQHPVPRRGGRADSVAAGQTTSRRLGVWPRPSQRPLPSRLSPAYRPCSSPSCRLSRRPPARLGPEKPSAPLVRPAPPAAPPLSLGRPKNPERGSVALPGRAAALGMLSS